jgi:hypothetical protein
MRSDMSGAMARASLRMKARRSTAALSSPAMVAGAAQPMVAGHGPKDDAQPAAGAHRAVRAHGPDPIAAMGERAGQQRRRGW